MHVNLSNEIKCKSITVSDLFLRSVSALTLLLDTFRRGRARSRLSYGWKKMFDKSATRVRVPELTPCSRM